MCSLYSFKKTKGLGSNSKDIETPSIDRNHSIKQAELCLLPGFSIFLNISNLVTLVITVSLVFLSYMLSSQKLYFIWKKEKAA